MKNKLNKKDKKVISSTNENRNDLEGYPIYPSTEDIYSNDHKEENFDLENISESKTFNKKFTQEIGNLGNVHNSDLAEELDVPGAELDDEQEKIGSEDEENNYYSIGGDNHNDLEEDRA